MFIRAVPPLRIPVASLGWRATNAACKVDDFKASAYGRCHYRIFEEILNGIVRSNYKFSVLQRNCATFDLTAARVFVCPDFEIMRKTVSV